MTYVYGRNNYIFIPKQMTEDGNEQVKPTEVEETIKSQTVETQEDLSNLTEDELKERINSLMDVELEVRNKELEKIRAYHPLRILLAKEIRLLALLKEEELTDEDKSRIKLATLRLTHHRYTGSGYSAKEKKKNKSVRRLVSASRKANR